MLASLVALILLSLVYCLKNILKEDQTLSALNYFHTQVKSSNELVHAKKVCSETGIDLVEIDASTSFPFDPLNQNPLLKPNKPFPGLISLNCLENVISHFKAKGSYMFFSGHGSDHIFMRPPSKAAIADYILEKGFTGSKEKTHDLIHFYRDPLFSVFKETAKNLSAYFLSYRLHKRHKNNIQDKIPK